MVLKWRIIKDIFELCEIFNGLQGKSEINNELIKFKKEDLNYLQFMHIGLNL